MLMDDDDDDNDDDGGGDDGDDSDYYNDNSADETIAEKNMKSWVYSHNTTKCKSQLIASYIYCILFITTITSNHYLLWTTATVITF